MSKRAKVNRMSTADINRVTAYLESQINHLGTRVKAIEDEDIDLLIKETVELELEKVLDANLDDLLEDKVDVDELTEKIYQKVWEKLGR